MMRFVKQRKIITVSVYWIVLDLIHFKEEIALLLTREMLKISFCLRECIPFNEECAKSQEDKIRKRMKEIPASIYLVLN